VQPELEGLGKGYGKLKVCAPSDSQFWLLGTQHKLEHNIRRPTRTIPPRRSPLSRLPFEPLLKMRAALSPHA